MIEDPNIPVIDLAIPEASTTPLQDLRSLNLFEILGMIEVVTTAPTAAPTNLYGQFKLYTDSITTPTVFTLYVYMPRIKLWKSVTLA